MDLQDDIDVAEEITDLRGSVATDISSFGPDTGTEPDPGDLSNNQSAWIKLTIAERSLVLLDTVGSRNLDDPPIQLDTEMALYSGTPGSLTLIEMNDEGTGMPFGASELARTLEPDTYYLEFAAYGGDAGILVFNWLVIPLGLHQSGTAVSIKDADGNVRPVEVETTAEGQVRQVVTIGGIAQTNDASNKLGSTQPALLSSALRVATTSSGSTPRFDNAIAVDRHGGDFVLRVTGNPGGGETLSMKLQVQDNISGAFVDWVDWGLVVTAANGTFHCLCYPGAIAADAAAGTKVKGLPLPNQFRIVITHSAGGGWTYELRWVPLD